MTHLVEIDGVTVAVKRRRFEPPYKWEIHGTRTRGFATTKRDAIKEAEREVKRQQRAGLL